MSRSPALTRLCPLCGHESVFRVRDFRRTVEPPVLEQLEKLHPGWKPSMAACPTCVDRSRWELTRGDSPLIRNAPLLRVGGYLVPPTPQRIDADPEVAGRGVTIAFVDSGFSLHPDLLMPQCRIRGYFDAEDPTASMADLAGPDILAWHGTMTSVGATGSGFLSSGVYRGVASKADVVLVRVSNDRGRQPDRNICAGLDWLLENRTRFALRIVNISLRGDASPDLGRGAVEQRVAALHEAGVLVVAASGNDLAPTLHPPASCPEALTVGGLDDGKAKRIGPSLYHSSYEAGGAPVKPEIVAPALFVASPILPGTEIFRQSRWIVAALLGEGKERRRIVARHRKLLGVPDEVVAAGGKLLLAWLQQLAVQNKLIAPYYHHADGTSVAAPIVSAVAAQILEVASFLRPAEVKEILIRTAVPLSGEAAERQGYGVVNAARAVAFARQLSYVLPR